MKHKRHIVWKYSLGGFVTIEYSLLLPVIFSIYVALIYLGLFQYNRCVLQSNTYLLAVENNKTIQSADTLEALKSLEKRLYNEKYLLIESRKITYYKKLANEYFKEDFAMNTPLNLFGIENHVLHFEIECKLRNLQPKDVLFLYKHYNEIKKDEEEIN